jgi:FkbM family methyltransferase
LPTSRCFAHDRPQASGLALAGVHVLGRVSQPAVDARNTRQGAMQGPTHKESSAFGLFAPQGLTAMILAMTRRCTTSWGGKRRAFFLRSLGVKALRGRPLDVETFGARMRLYPYNNVCEKRILFTPQYFDPSERDLLLQRITPDFVFIDIGANIGGYTLFAAAHAGPRARILAIEPQPEVFERLLYNIQQNGFANMKALDCAVADVDGEITLFVHGGNRGETSMRIINSDARSARLRVPAKSLKSIVAQENFSRIDAIKLDVGGAEDVILEPYLTEVKPALWPKLILMEYSHGPWSIDIDALLRKCGYREVLRTRGNVAYERD